MEGGGPAFYLCDIYDWVRDPKGYRRFEKNNPQEALVTKTAVNTSNRFNVAQ
jgi:hypothetical protein